MFRFSIKFIKSMLWEWKKEICFVMIGIVLCVCVIINFADSFYSFTTMYWGAETKEDLSYNENRANYMLPIDFESFKESGSIEYSADVVWGLQLQIINDQAFTQAKGVSQKRRMIAMAKAASPRKVEMVCLKNRYGIASYNCGFLYYPQFDLFTPDPQFKSSAPICPTPQIII